MFTLMIIILLLLSVALIGIVLLQPGKGDMIAGMSGLGGAFTNILGSRRAADMLSKITIGLAAAIMILSLVTNKFFLNNDAVTGPRPMIEGERVPSSTPQTPFQAPAQAQPAQEQKQAAPATEPTAAPAEEKKAEEKK